MKRSPFLSLVVFSALYLSAPFSFAEGAYVKPAAPDRIAHGEEVKLEKYIIPGKTTVFDFTSEYCPPCRAVSPRLDKLHAKRDDVVVVKIDINRPGVKGIDWKSPVAAQYGMRSIPNFKVYGPNGKLQAEGKEASELVYSWLE